jgi:DNA-binding transcriptional LysR family regulator
MPTDKNSVALYIKVVQGGSFTKAAAGAGLPVSTVSRRIRSLESELGVRLLERSTRQLRMTSIGQEFFALCERGLLDIEAAEALVSNRQLHLSGCLRISVPPSMSDLVVLPLVVGFRQEHPNVKVHCLVTDRFIDHIADGVDLSLRVGDPPDSSLVVSTVTVHRPRLVASPKYLGGLAQLDHPDSIASHVQVAFSRLAQPIRWTLTWGVHKAQVEPVPGLVLNDYAGVLRGVVDGHGISEVPSFMCNSCLRAGTLVEVLPHWKFPSVRVSATYPSHRQLSPLVRAFKEHCARYFERSPLADGN